MVKRVLWVSMVMLVAVTMGCTTTQKWMAGGAAVGATVGGIWAANGGCLNAGEGAAVGAVTGATVGALVGDQMEIAQEWKALSDENDKLAKENADLKEENRAMQTKLQACQSDLDAANRRIESLNGEIANLKDELAKCKGAHMELSLPTDLLFASGSNRLTDAGKKALKEAAAKVKESYPDMYVTVDGHTDIDPIKSSNWKDNWDLGSARAMAVMRYLITQGIAAEKCSAATYAEFQPVDKATTKEAKAKNRRAVIVLHTGWPRF